jgi:tetratricopeptide (TPR) repeat protein
MRKYLKLFLIEIIAINFICLGFCSVASASSKQQAEQYRDSGLKAQAEGDMEKAYENYQKAQELYPTWPVIYNDLGIILEAKAQLNEAEAMYFKAMALDDKYPSSYTNLAILYERKQDFSNAIFYWKKRIEFGPANDIWVERAKERIRILGLYEPEEVKDRLASPKITNTDNIGKDLSADKYNNKIVLKKPVENGSEAMDKISIKGLNGDTSGKKKAVLFYREQGFNLLAQDTEKEINAAEAPLLNKIKEEKDLLKTEQKEQWDSLNLDNKYCLATLADISKNDPRERIRETAQRVLWLHDQGYDISAKSEWQKIRNVQGLPPDDSE